MSVANAPIFTADWSGPRSYWPSMFADIGLAGKPDLRFLEVGCFEGMTTLWLIENVLTDESSTITVVDTFEGSPEFDQFDIDVTDLFGRFMRNVGGHVDSGKVVVERGMSQQRLRTLDGPFDFVYVDGGHLAVEALTDAVLCWPLLRSGGMMVFDDYRWCPDPSATAWRIPKLGLDAFRQVFAEELIVRLDDYQLVVEKR